MPQSDSNLTHHHHRAILRIPHQRCELLWLRLQVAGEEVGDVAADESGALDRVRREECAIDCVGECLCQCVREWACLRVCAHVWKVSEHECIRCVMRVQARARTASRLSWTRTFNLGAERVCFVEGADALVLLVAEYGEVDRPCDGEFVPFNGCLWYVVRQHDRVSGHSRKFQVECGTGLRVPLTFASASACVLVVQRNFFVCVLCV